MLRMNLRNLYLICASLCMISGLRGTAPNTIIGTVDDPTASFNSPNGITISPDGHWAYVINTNPSSNTISVIDLTQSPAQVTAVITDYLFGLLRDTAFSPDSSRAYVTDRSNHKVWIIDVPTHTVTGAVTDSSFNLPTGITMAPNGKKAYVANQSGPSVSIIDTDPTSPSYNTVTGLVTANILYPFTAPTWIAFTPDGTKAYVTNASGFDSTINVINAISDTVTQYVSGLFYNPNDILITPDGTTAYVPQNSTSQISIIDVATDSIASPANVTDTLSLLNGPTYLAITPDGKALYALNPRADSVTIIDTATNATVVDVLDPLMTLNTPFAMAITPDGSTGYITNTTGGSGNGSVSILLITSILPPNSISGCKTKNVFLLQTDYINNITWSAPASGSPAAYNIYRDAALTDLAGSSTSLEFYDHNRQPNIIYSYYIVSVDASGNQSASASVTVNTSC